MPGPLWVLSDPPCPTAEQAPKESAPRRKRNTLCWATGAPAASDPTAPAMLSWHSSHSARLWLCWGAGWEKRGCI